MSNAAASPNAGWWPTIRTLSSPSGQFAAFMIASGEAPGAISGSALGRALRLRVAPHLHFAPDEELERSNRLDQLIGRAVRDDRARHVADDTGQETAAHDDSHYDSRDDDAEDDANAPQAHDGRGCGPK